MYTISESVELKNIKKLYKLDFKSLIAEISYIIQTAPLGFLQVQFAMSIDMQPS